MDQKFIDKLAAYTRVLEKKLSTDTHAFTFDEPDLDSAITLQEFCKDYNAVNLVVYHQ